MLKLAILTQFKKQGNMSVYTVVSQAELESFLLQYDLGELVAFEGISAGIENTNYFVDTTQGRFVLTLFEQHAAEELDYFMQIMAFMAEHQVPTAHPAKSLTGDYILTLKEKPAALVARLAGSGVEHPSLTQCAVMGENLAKFHLASRDFQDYRANDRDLNWMQQTYRLIESFLTEADSQFVAEELTYLEPFDFAHLPQGVIHADLFCDNALFEGDELSGIIDLYYACNGALLYDLAVMANEWARLPDCTLEAVKVEAILAAYQTVRPLTEAEQTAWQGALRLGGLRFFLSRLKDKVMPREGELTQIKDPDVFKQLLNFHRQQIA